MRYLFLLIFLLINCKSTGNLKTNLDDNSYSFTKKEGFNQSTKKVSTLSVYLRDTKKIAEPSDVFSNIVGNSIDAKIGEIYGEAMVGGNAIKEIAVKLKLKDFDKSIQNLVESQLDGVPLLPETKKIFQTITEKGKIDSLAFPVLSGGTEKILKNEKVEVSLIVFDGKSGSVQYTAKKNKLGMKPEDFSLLQSKPDQARANTTAVLLEAINAFMLKVQTDVKPESMVSKPQKDETKKEAQTSTASSTSETKDSEPKEKEALEPLDEWLVKRIKVGLGPLMVGFVGFLFLFL